MEDSNKFYKKLKKLIEKECPLQCRVVYDELQTALFVINTDSKVDDNENKGIQLCSPNSSCTTIGKRSSNKTGHSKSNIIGEGIFVELEAVQF